MLAQKLHISIRAEELVPFNMMVRKSTHPDGLKPGFILDY